MNYRIFVNVGVLIVVLMLAAPLVSAIPGSTKDNEKFLTFQINKIGGPPVGPVVITYHPAPPKEAELTKMVIPEGMSYVEILVEDHDPYILNEDFTYESTLTLTFHANSYPPVAGCIVEQKYVFLPESGIVGTLEVRTVGKFWKTGLDGSSSVYSYGSSVGHGTGDLQDVQVRLTGWHLPTGMVHHEGTVTGWP